MLSPSRLRADGAGHLAALEPRADDEVVHGAPAQRDRHDRELGEQRLAVARRPQIVRLPGSRAMDRYVPARTSTATSTVAIREKPRNASRRSSGASGQTHVASATRPPTQSIAATRWSQSAKPREEGRVRLHALMPREREPGREPEPDEEAPARAATDGRGSTTRSTSAVDERVPERHRDERDAEARLRRDRREVAVQEVDERELQRVLGPHDEGGDADVEHGDATDGREPVEAVRKPRRQRLAEDEQPEPDRPEQRARARRRTPSGRRRPPRSAPSSRRPPSAAAASTPMPNV